jgi:hypothetical protein
MFERPLIGRAETCSAAAVRKARSTVIPAEAGIQNVLVLLDPGFEPALDSIQSLPWTRSRGRDDEPRCFSAFTTSPT